MRHLATDGHSRVGSKSDGIVDDEAVAKFLKEFETHPSLIRLYSRLFETAVSLTKDQAKGKYAEVALECLTVVRRPLSIGELAFVVFLNEFLDDGLETPYEYSGYMDQIRPFVRMDEKTGRYSLVHQSLVGLILHKPPTQWESLMEGTAGPASDAEKLERQQTLHADLLSRCVKYMMLDDCQKKDLPGQLREPATEYAIREMFRFEGYFDSEETDLDKRLEEDEEASKLLTHFDPDDYGFGKFFAYAGAYWLDHFAATSLDRRLEPSKFVELCGHGTQGLSNWAEVWKKPSCRFVDERPDVDVEELDPLTVMARVDRTPATLGMILQEMRINPLSSQVFPRWEMLSMFIRQGICDVPAILWLLEDPVMSPEFCDDHVLIWILREFGAKKDWDPADWPGSPWEEVFKVVIEKLGPRLKPRAHFTLRLACKQGCLILVKLLFKAVEKWPELGVEMLSDRRPRADEEPKSSLAVHQSVGEAANWNHVRIVRFLCQQSGIEPHLKYVNPNGYNIFHQCARYPHSELFEILIPLWPQGVYETNKYGDTPLDLLIFSHEFSEDPEDDNTAALRTLLRMSRYEATYLDEQPMRLATSKANIFLCRLFVEDYGADPWKVVEVGPDGVADFCDDRRPFVGPNQDEREVFGSVLRCFCDLTGLPIPDAYM